MNQLLHNLLNFFHRLIEPNNTVNDPIQRQQIRLLNSVVFLFVPIALAVGLFQILADPDVDGLLADPGLIVITIAVIFLVSAYIAGRRIGYGWAVGIIIVTGYVIIVINAFVDDVYLVDIAFILLLSVIASMIVSVRTLIALAIIQVITASTFYVIVSPDDFIGGKITTLIVVSNILIVLTSYYRSLLERDRQQRLSDSESFLRTITEQLPVSVWITDNKLHRRATFGRMPTSAQVETIPDRKSMQAYQTALAGESSQFETKQGKHYYQYHLEPMRDEANGIIGTLGVATDITEQKIAQQQASQLELERKRVEMLSQFIEYSSHDLRTPISNINTYLYLLNNSVTSEKEKQYIGVIREQSNRLHNLIENMLMLQRLELGKTESFIEMSLQSLLEEIEITCRPRVEKAGLTFDYTQADNNTILKIENQQMFTALTKIIDNAIQYTDTGGTISLTYQTDADSVIIEIRDTGLGIPEDQLPHIFDMFYRGDNSRSSATGDNGLGLTIAKRIIEAHGGEIRVDSEVGVGTSVFVTLSAHVVEMSLPHD